MPRKYITTKLPAHVELRFSREAAEAAERLLDDLNHYPGLKFGGDHESFKKFKADILLLAEEYAELFLAGTKHIKAALNN